MNKKIREQKMSAMITVEAAFLVPFLIIIIVYCIFLAFHLYNADIAYQSAYLASLRASGHTEVTHSDRYQIASEEYERLTNGQLIAAAYSGRKIEAQAGYVAVEYQIQTEAILPEPFGREEHFLASDSLRCNVMNPVTLIRTYRTVKQLIDEGEEDGTIAGD